MKNQAVLVPYMLALGALVIAMDLMFFRNHTGERLIANVGVVVVFGGVYLRFLKHP